MLTHVDLFSGIGGFSLAASWAGFRTVVFCEKDEFCQRVLRARFGGKLCLNESSVKYSDTSGDTKASIRNINSRIVSDVEHGKGEKFNRAIVANSDGTGHQGSHGGIDTETKGNLRGATEGDVSAQRDGIPIVPDIFNLDGTAYRGATLLTGGFPCQPFSIAGKRRGEDDDRHLWPEMFRVISEAQPRWILAENVPGIINMELDTVLADLEGEGYEVGPIIIPAAGVNAPHRRYRVWIIANNERNGQQGKRVSIREGQEKDPDADRENRTTPDSARIGLNRAGNTGPGWREESTGGNRSDPHAERKGLPQPQEVGIREQLLNAQRESWEIPWLEVATEFCRVDDGVPDRVHRLKALGNAIVPQVAYEIIKGIALIEATTPGLTGDKSTQGGGNNVT